MQVLIASTAGVLAFVGSAQASDYLLKNYCTTDLTLYFSAPNVKPANETFPSGLAYVQAISGDGNSLAVTKGDNGPNGIYDPSVPKLVLGTSASSGTLWWSVSSQNGDPFAGQEFNVTTDGKCGETTDYSGGTKSCPDDGVTLTVNFCSNNQ